VMAVTNRVMVETLAAVTIAVVISLQAALTKIGAHARKFKIAI